VLPRTGDTDSHYAKELEFLTANAEKAGLVVIDLWDVYGPVRDRGDLKLAPWDWHPNAQGHEALGLRIYQDLMELDFVRLAAAGSESTISHNKIETQTKRKTNGT
jgi:hypothetical protein